MRVYARSGAEHITFASHTYWRNPWSTASGAISALQAPNSRNGVTSPESPARCGENLPAPIFVRTAVNPIHEAWFR